ncbi:MAG: flagellar biosynthetic protein FliO [Oscillospiraceae bacterium]|nr:flagellar biosynthetic protein FliO [Oscillospiraceae bacterium]
MDIIWVVFSLIGVLGLFFLLIYGLNKLNKKIGIISGSKMRVLDRVNLGRDGMILVVSVAGKLMLISATSQHIEKLCDLEMTPEEYMQQLQNEAEQSRNNFSSVLASVMSRNNSGKDNKND